MGAGGDSTNEALMANKQVVNIRMTATATASATAKHTANQGIVEAALQAYSQATSRDQSINAAKTMAIIEAEEEDVVIIKSLS
jgi:hypothetical protein